MTLSKILLYAGLAFVPCLILGIIYKSLYRTCWTILPYLVLVWLGDAVEWLAPKYHVWDVYYAKEVSVAVVKIALGLELYLRLFAGLPGARRFANILVLASLGVTLWYLVEAGRTVGPDPVELYRRFIPICNDGTTLVLTTVLALATWYKVPAPALHRAILRGLGAFLIVNTLGIHLFAAIGWGSRPFVNVVSAVAYDTLLVYWLFAVWRPGPRDLGPPAVMRRLRTWASSS